MSSPISVDLPHKLGAAEARRRIANGMGRLGDQLPAAAKVESSWAGDSMSLRVTALGQEVNARIDVAETVVHLEVLLPPALSFFGKAIEAGLRREGGRLLEDRNRR